MPSKNVIQVFEHQTIRVGQNFANGHNTITFKDAHLDALARYNEQHHNKYYTLVRNGVKFSQYVGALQVGNLTIEILPKADKQRNDKQTWHNNLLKMLRECRLLRLESFDEANLRLKSNSILDMYIELFLNEVQKLIKQGLVKKYRREHHNSYALKGRLMIQQHLTRNIVHKERFYISHQIYDQDNVFNRILFKTINILPTIIRDGYLKDKLNRILFRFPEVNDIHVDDALFDRLTYGRKTERYKKAINIARLLLLNYRPDIRHGNQSLIAILFDMNRLWEEYVFRLFRKLEGIQAYRQKSREFWKPDKGGPVTIRPDIIIKKEGETIVVDTKWKWIHEHRPSDEDLKQMFTYNLYWGVSQSILLYPGSSSDSGGTFYEFPEDNKKKSNRRCKLAFVDVNRLMCSENTEELCSALEGLKQ